jgi:hypothetical protein
VKSESPTGSGLGEEKDLLSQQSLLYEMHPFYCQLRKQQQKDGLGRERRRRRCRPGASR